MVKAAALGWMVELEQLKKVPGKKSKTMIYWRKMIRNAGLDPTKIEDLTKDRKEWKKKVKERVEYLLKYDESKGNKYEGPILTRNIDRTPQEDDLTCVECGKQCKSKGGLTNHRRLKHGNIEKTLTNPCRSFDETSTERRRNFNETSTQL